MPFSTWKWVCIGSLLVMHLGLLHLTIPRISSGVVTIFFSTTSNPLIMFNTTFGATTERREISSSVKNLFSTLMMPLRPSFLEVVTDSHWCVQTGKLQ